MQLPPTGGSFVHHIPQWMWYACSVVQQKQRTCIFRCLWRAGFIVCDMLIELSALEWRNWWRPLSRVCARDDPRLIQLARIKKRRLRSNLRIRQHRSATRPKQNSVDEMHDVDMMMMMMMMVIG
jgi:hypothetical protein